MNGGVSPGSQPLGPGLYLVATPIGAARDITLRALDVLNTADVLAAEDTRTLRHLMDIHGIALRDRPLLAYHDHNGPKARPRLIAAMKEGKSVAYASEAGTPLVADPGFDLARAAAAEGIAVTAVPGASAVLAALTVAGLPTDRFMFAGFPPPTASARRAWLQDLRAIPATLVLYESPNRLKDTLNDLVSVMGADRRAAIARELTKRFEETTRGTLESLCAAYRDRDVKGEIVILIDRSDRPAASEADVRELLTRALQDMSLKDAAQSVAEATGLPRRDVYQMALRLGDAT